VRDEKKLLCGRVQWPVKSQRLPCGRLHIQLEDCSHPAIVRRRAALNIKTMSTVCKIASSKCGNPFSCAPISTSLEVGCVSTRASTVRAGRGRLHGSCGKGGVSTNRVGTGAPPVQAERSSALRSNLLSTPERSEAPMHLLCSTPYQLLSLPHPQEQALRRCKFSPCPVYTSWPRIFRFPSGWR
jgi:hypothetical protein